MTHILMSIEFDNFSISLEYKLADMWIGIYYAKIGHVMHIWACFLPCLPIHIKFKDAKNA